MINSVQKLITKKDIVLFNKHRQTVPIVENIINKRNYIFINCNFLMKIPIRSKYKSKYKIVYFILNVIKPKLILDINWISSMSSLYKVWTKNHSQSSFVVVQHGSYVGGIVTDIAHRYTKCDIFLVWGEYFKTIFQNYNSNKKVEIINYGNPVFNDNDRENFKYKKNEIKKILLAPSAIKGKPLKQLYLLHNMLLEIGFHVRIKKHNMQDKYFSIIKGIEVEEEISSNVLKNQKYDLIISDHSTFVLDAIFFKNPVICFSYIETEFTNYITNIYRSYSTIENHKDLFKHVNISNQEKLLEDMISIKTNILDL